jgi:hypothetical protein
LAIFVHFYDLFFSKIREHGLGNEPSFLPKMCGYFSVMKLNYSPSKILICSIYTMALLGAAIVPASSTVLANYDFGTLSGLTYSRVSTDLNADSTAGNWLDGAGWTSTGSTAGNLPTSAAVTNVQTDSLSATDLAGAVAANDYFTFTLNINSGFQANLSSLTLDYNRSSTTASTVFVRSSADGFTLNLGNVTTTTTFQNLSIDLTPAAFQGLITPIEFRVYVADSSASTSQSTRIDNVVLNGTVDAVPEPSTWAILTCGLLLLVGKKRLTAYSKNSSAS